MKRIQLPLLCLVLFAIACGDTASPPAEMPATRPADFEVGFSERGGPDAPSSDYRVKATEAWYADLSSGERREWKFTPTPADLDQLYADLRALKVTDLRAEKEEGKDESRFGYALEMTYGGQRFSVADKGPEYIQLEADYNRFMDVIATIREFVSQGIADQIVPLKAAILLDPKAPKPDSIGLMVEQRELVTGYAEMKAGDTLSGESRLLTGNYKLVAKARVGEKSWSWEKEVAHGKGGSSWMVRLGKEGFVEVGE